MLSILGQNDLHFGPKRFAFWAKTVCILGQNGNERDVVLGLEQGCNGCFRHKHLVLWKRMTNFVGEKVKPLNNMMV